MGGVIASESVGDLGRRNGLVFYIHVNHVYNYELLIFCMIPDYIKQFDK